MLCIDSGREIGTEIHAPWTRIFHALIMVAIPFDLTVNIAVQQVTATLAIGSQAIYL